jgi:hypothetical protein
MSRAFENTINPINIQNPSTVSLQRVKEKCIPIPVTGRGGLEDFLILRIPRCLNNQLTDDEFVSLKHRPRSTPQKPFFNSVSGTNFC